MSIQRAEELKRQWTDKFVQVQSGIPELRRFEGLVGTVRTVNMNCRLLIEFDTPADISWYDIDPQYVNVTAEHEVAKINTTATDTEKPSEPAKAKTENAAIAPQSTSGGANPLDKIRAQAAGSASVKDGIAAPAANPLDQIRASAAASSAIAADAKPMPAANPLDQIRQQATAPDSTAQKPSGTSTSSPANPLDAIRQQNAAAVSPTSDSTSADSKTANSGSALDQIRAQNSANTETTETRSDAAAAASNSSPAAKGTNPLDQIRAAGAAKPSADLASNSANAAAAGPQSDSEANSSAAESTAGSVEANKTDNADSADTQETSSAASSAPPPASLMSSTPPPAVEELPASERNPMNQVAEQAGSASGDSQFEQVRQQASGEVKSASTEDTPAESEPEVSSSSTEDTTATANASGEMQQQSLFDSKAADDSGSSDGSSETAGSLASVAGIEDPVKATFRGKKLPKQDDLKIVEGIGPKIEGLFNDDGIATWKQLSDADPARLRKILEDAGPRFRMHSPDTWPNQARLADEGKWQELEEYQDLLQGGRDPNAD